MQDVELADLGIAEALAPTRANGNDAAFRVKQQRTFTTFGESEAASRVRRPRTFHTFAASVGVTLVLFIIIPLTLFLQYRTVRPAVDENARQGAIGTSSNMSCGETCQPGGASSLRFRIIVINLDRRRDRLDRFVAALQAGPGAFMVPSLCRLPAVDGTNKATLDEIVRRGYVSKQNVEAAVARTESGGLTAGAIGCYTSHWEAMRLIAGDESIDFGLVAEDDLTRFSPVFWEQLSLLWNNTQGKANSLWETTGLIYLQYESERDQKADFARGVKETLLTEAGWPKNNALYAVSRAGAAYLAGEHGGASLGALLPMAAPLDSVLPGWYRGIQYKRFDPPIAQAVNAIELEGDTDIQVSGNRPPAEHLQSKGDAVVATCHGLEL